MNLIKLYSMLPPPESPLEVPSRDAWDRYQADLCELPKDYKEFINAYGTGVIDDFFWVFNPHATNEYLNLLDQANSILSTLLETKSKFPDMYRMTCYPEPGGFLPFAGTDNGDNLFWVTDGKPDQWTVAVMGPRSPECHYQNSGIVEFLVKLISGDICCDVFPSDFPSDPPLSFSSTLG